VNIIGIDPGLHGAVCFMDGFSGIVVRDLPIVGDGKLRWIDGAVLFSWLMEYAAQPARVVVERVHSMPAQGVASSFQFGVGFGSILSIVQARQCPLEFVTPSTWKKALGLSQEKKASLHKARLLYPDADLTLEKHEGRAEAILIAHWARTRQS
jgi:crossover junction endodeoxyribonuclease RuvC